MSTVPKNSNNGNKDITFNIEINTGDSNLSEKDKLEFRDLEKKYPKWHIGVMTKQKEFAINVSE